MKTNYKMTKYAAYMGYVTQAIINNLAPLLFVTFQKQYSISLEKIAMLISINFGVQIITDFLAAKYVDRIGYRPAIVAAHILCTIGLLGLGIFPQNFNDPYIGLLVAIMINAVGGGLIEVLISPIVEALPGDEKESAMSLLHSFYCWGSVGVVVFTTLFFRTLGIENWNFLTALWAIVPFSTAILFLIVPVKTLVEKEDAIPLKQLFQVKVFWLLFIMMVCAGAAEQAMSQWSSYFAESGLHVSKTLGDLLGPCAFAFLMGIARTIYGIKGSKMNLKVTIVLCSLLCIISYLVVVFSPIPILALLACSICGFSVGIMWPGVFSLSAKAYPRGGTAMFAILALAGDLGCSSGPGIVGIIANRSGNLNMGFLVAIIFPIILSLCLVMLRTKKKA